MPTVHGHILIVDDNVVNRMVLARALAEQGHTTTAAQDGHEALDLLRGGAFDAVLLDVMMPEMDGYETLAQIKRDEDLRHIPVIMVSAVDEMDSVVRCIEMGATDYLPKPYNAALLQARLSASLASKRLRDLELEYLEQVGYVAEAAAAVETGAFEPERLDPVAGRADALGRLARVFQQMAREVYAREQRLKLQLQQLQLDIEERQRAAGETAAVYVPMDRRQALARAADLPDRSRGAALFADISGFTPLTDSLARELGLQRGAEEVTRQLNRIYDALIDQVHAHGGSVVGFSGDAITCWLDGDTGLRAAACALAMQAAARQFEQVQTPAGTTISIGIKVAICAGPVRRFRAGHPAIQTVEILAGGLLDELARIEHHAGRDEVLMSESTAAACGSEVIVAGWRTDSETGRRMAQISGTAGPASSYLAPWPALTPGQVPNPVARPWLLPAVYDKVQSGKSEFLSELRPAAALLMKFGGLDYDGDDGAGDKLNAFICWVQSVVARFDGSLVQVTMGDKGSYLYSTFGAPVAHADDGLRAVQAARSLSAVPPELEFVSGVQIGLAYGQMRAGAYGGAAQRAYGVIGEKTNLAARLMMASDGAILCDEAIMSLAQSAMDFELLPAMQFKGKVQPVPVYRLSGARSGLENQIDHLTSAQQLALKVASVIGPIFRLSLLEAIYPVAADRPELPDLLAALVDEHLLAYLPVPGEPDLSYHFADSSIQETAYNLMLFAQRRQLHRAAAEWHETVYAETLDGHFATLAHHWKWAEDTRRAVYYLEKAGEQARQRGAFAEAQAFFNESLALDSQPRPVEARGP
jgi:CheY-like chemotaxis protein/class 3 adenylate cyclase